MSGGNAGFNVVFGGGRVDGEFRRHGDHGYYWTATETDSANAWFYNFSGARFLKRHAGGNKPGALSVRCVSD